MNRQTTQNTNNDEYVQYFRILILSFHSAIFESKFEADELWILRVIRDVEIDYI